jgi:hypothetical protein
MSISQPHHNGTRRFEAYLPSHVKELNVASVHGSLCLSLELGRCVKRQ